MFADSSLGLRFEKVLHVTSLEDVGNGMEVIILAQTASMLNTASVFNVMQQNSAVLSVENNSSVHHMLSDRQAVNIANIHTQETQSGTVSTLSDMPNDTYIDLLYGMGDGDGGSNILSQWQAGNIGAMNTVVGVIDEGIDVRHIDLYGNIFINVNEITQSLRTQLADTDEDGVISFRDLNHAQNASLVSDWNNNGYIDGEDLINDADWENGQDDDNNGYTDDLVGWDFYHDDNDVFDSAEFDSHGTHVAGTIGAMGNNGEGVAGANWDIRIIPIKFLDEGGGSTADAIAALSYYNGLASDAGEADHFVGTNNSWGGGSYSQNLAQMIIDTAKEDQLFIAAAGNASNNNDVNASYPANYTTLYQQGVAYDAVISVAAMDEDGILAGFTNYGATTVDLVAAGVSIASTSPNGAYAYMSGTSMASPLITGAAALLASLNTQMSAADLRDLLLDTKALNSANGKVATDGKLYLEMPDEQPLFETFSSQNLTQAIQGLQFGEDLERFSIDNIQYAGSMEASSIYSGTLPLGIGAGILLTSGSGTPSTENTTGSYTAVNGAYGDEDLLLAAKAGLGNNASSTNDASVVSFSITVSDPSVSTIAIDLMLGSEEYPEFANSFVDVAAVFVNGVNYALVNGQSNQPFSVLQKNIDDGFFRDNTTNQLPIEYDGISNKVTVFLPVNIGANSIKIGIADTNDSAYDSGLFVSNLRVAQGAGDGSGLKIVVDVPNEDGIYMGGTNDEAFEGSNSDEEFETGGGDDVVDAGGGDDQVTVSGSSEGDQLLIDGGEGEDTLSLTQFAFANLVSVTSIVSGAKQGVSLAFNLPDQAQNRLLTSAGEVTVNTFDVESFRFSDDGVLSLDELQTLSFDVDLAFSVTHDDKYLTNKAQFTVNGLTDGESLSYTVYQTLKGNEKIFKKATTAIPDDEGNLSLEKVIKKDGDYRVVIETDNGDTAELNFTLDVKAPTAPSVKLTSDVGVKKTDGITDSATFTLAKLEADAQVEVNLNDGNGWQSVTVEEGMVNLEELSILEGSYKVGFRQVDLVGNMSKISSVKKFVYDMSAPEMVAKDATLEITSGITKAMAVIQSTEKLIGLDKKDFIFSSDSELFNAARFKISSVKEKLVDDVYEYSVLISLDKAFNTSTGNVVMTLKDNEEAGIQDYAGNIALVGVGDHISFSIY